MESNGSTSVSNWTREIQSPPHRRKRQHRNSQPIEPKTQEFTPQRLPSAPKIGWARIGRRQDANLFHFPPGNGTQQAPQSAAGGEEGRSEGGPWTYHGVAFAGVEGGLLRAHGERVELRERVGGAPEGPVERPVRLLQARRLRLALLPGHPSQSPLRSSRSRSVRRRPSPGEGREP